MIFSSDFSLTCVDHYDHNIFIPGLLNINSSLSSIWKLCSKYDTSFVYFTLSSRRFKHSMENILYVYFRLFKNNYQIKLILCAIFFLLKSINIIGQYSVIIKIIYWSYRLCCNILFFKFT